MPGAEPLWSLLGVDVHHPPARDGAAAIEAWASSGGMALTGHADGPGLAGAAGLLVAAAEAAATVASLAPGVDVDPALLLFGRAGLTGGRRAGRASVGGSCRLLPAADGWLAVNLARADDLASLPAVLEAELGGAPPFDALAEAATSRPADVLAARLQLLGVPGAVLGSVDGDAPVRVAAGREERPPAGRPLVVDLSSLWAGPLCAHLLGAAGSRVVKVESSSRPDGARGGPRAFFDWLHGGHEAVAVDLHEPAGVAALRRLLDRADIVVESSRPRALAQLGIDATELAAAGRTWVSITGYGRDDAEQRVAFGDDAAVAGGAVGWAGPGDPVFAGDALADPLTGLYAAAAALAIHRAGRGGLVDVALARVAGHAAARAATVGVDPHAPAPPALPPPRPRPIARAPRLGEHTAAVLAELATP